MLELTPEGRRTIEDVARRHGVSGDAVLVLLGALVAGGGTMAQFSHPDLGGMGQWSQGGMIMVGDMFNQALKYRVDALCSELAGLLQREQPRLIAPPPSQSQFQSQGGGLFAGGQSPMQWWPAELGSPDTAGAQNGLRYAYFRAARRLAVERDGRLTLHDTGDHQIGGVSQQQGGEQSLTFTSQYGPVRVSDLPVIGPAPANAPEPFVAAPQAPVPSTNFAPEPPEPPAPAPQAAAVLPVDAGSARPAGDPLAMIERLAELRQKGILTEEEFAAKKAELLSRL